MSYTVKFCNTNDTWPRRYLIVCVDKTWGSSGCQPWTGDWVYNDPVLIGECVTSPAFTPSKVLTAVTSSDSGNYYSVEFLDSQGRVVKRCDRVDRNNPCYLEIQSDKAIVRDYNVSTTNPYVNQPVRIKATGYITASSGQYDFGVGVAYDYGPADSINSPCGPLPKGYACVTRAPSRSVGTTWTHEHDYSFPQPGTYVISVEAGYISGNTIYVTDYKQVNITAQPTPTPTQPPPTQPPPTQPPPTQPPPTQPPPPPIPTPMPGWDWLIIALVIALFMVLILALVLILKE